MFQANHEPSSILPAAERRIIPFPRRHPRRPDAPIISVPEASAHLLPKVAAAGGDDGDDGRGKRRKRARLRLVKTLKCHHLSRSSSFIRSEGVLMAEAMLVLRNVAWKHAFASINMMRIAEVKS